MANSIARQAQVSACIYRMNMDTGGHSINIIAYLIILK